MTGVGVEVATGMSCVLLVEDCPGCNDTLELSEPCGHMLQHNLNHVDVPVAGHH